MLKNKDIPIKYYRKMNDIIRLPGIYKHRNYSLTEHSFHVAILFQFFAEKENIEYSLEDLNTVLRHDLVETVTADCPYHVKNFKQKTKEAWDTIESEVVSTFPFLSIYMDDGDSMGYLSDECFHLMKACDLLELFIFCIEELRLGNKQKDLKKVIKKCVDLINGIRFNKITLFISEYLTEEEKYEFF